METSTTFAEKKEEVFSRRVRAGKRTYFFDVKATKSEKDFYITITESKKVGEDEFKKHKIFLYKEDFEKFIDGLNEAVDNIRENAPPVTSSDAGTGNEGNENHTSESNINFEDLGN